MRFIVPLSLLLASTCDGGLTAADILWLDLVAGLVSVKDRSVCRLGIVPEDGDGAVITGGVTSGVVGTVVNVPALWKLPASVTVLAWPGVSQKS